MPGLRVVARRVTVQRCDGFGPSLAFCSPQAERLSQSLAQCSLVTARCPLRFGVSIQIDAGFQLAIYAIVEMRRSRVLRRQKSEAAEAKPDLLSAQLRTHLR